jgi:hypothetical protein
VTSGTYKPGDDPCRFLIGSASEAVDRYMQLEVPQPIRAWGLQDAGPQARQRNVYFNVCQGNGIYADLAAPSSRSRRSLP